MAGANALYTTLDDAIPRRHRHGTDLYAFTSHPDTRRPPGARKTPGWQPSGPSGNARRPQDTSDADRPCRNSGDGRDLDTCYDVNAVPTTDKHLRNHGTGCTDVRPAKTSLPGRQTVEDRVNSSRAHWGSNNGLICEILRSRRRNALLRRAGTVGSKRVRSDPQTRRGPSKLREALSRTQTRIPGRWATRNRSCRMDELSAKKTNRSDPRHARLPKLLRRLRDCSAPSRPISQ